MTPIEEIPLPPPKAAPTNDTSNNSAAQTEQEKEAAQEASGLPEHNDGANGDTKVVIKEAAGSSNNEFDKETKGKEQEKNNDNVIIVEGEGKKEEELLTEKLQVQPTKDYDNTAARSKDGEDKESIFKAALSQLTKRINDDQEGTRIKIDDIESKVDQLYEMAQRALGRDALLAKLYRELVIINPPLSRYTDVNSSTYKDMLKAECSMSRLIDENVKVKDAMERSARVWTKEARTLDIVSIIPLLQIIQPLYDTLDQVEKELTRIIEAMEARSDPSNNNTQPLHCIFCETNTHASIDCYETNNFADRKIAADKKGICVKCARSMNGETEHEQHCRSKDAICHLCPFIDYSMRKHHPIFCFSTNGGNQQGNLKQKLDTDAAPEEPEPKKPKTTVDQDQQQR